MTPRELLRALRAAHVSLSLEGERLRCVAPAGALTPALRSALDEHRDAVIRLLRLSEAPAPLPPRTPPFTPFPLSHAQQRIWFLDQIAGAQTAYIMPAAAYVRGLDVPTLERALGHLVDRHAALRTRFGRVDGEPVQWEIPQVPVALPVVSLEDVPEALRRTTAERRAAEEAVRPLDLELAPLFRTGLFRLSADEHLWYLGLHHLVADGMSIRILVGEVLDTYARLSQGDDNPPPLPAVQYDTFVAWQHVRLQSDACAASLRYWRDTLAGLAPLNLPTDRPRTPDKSFRGGCEMLHVAAPLTERLRAMARERGASLHALLLAALQVVLARSAAQGDVAVGTAMANRTRQEFEGLVGCVANTVVIRTEVAADVPFVDLLDRVQEHVRQAWSHQELPFEQLVQTLKAREAGRNPIFDVFFTLNVPNPPVTRAGVTFQPVFLATSAAKFELGLFCEEAPDGIRGFLEYQSDLFDADTVRRILRRLVAVLGGIAEAPHTIVGRLPLLDDEERAVIQARWRASRRPFSHEAAFHDLFVAQAQRTPDAIAVADEQRAMSYAELDRQSSTVARALRRLGARRGTVLGLAVERSVEMLVALLGIVKAGAAYVPLDSAFPAERLRFIVDDSGASAVVASVMAGVGTPGLREQLRGVVPHGMPLHLLEDMLVAETNDRTTDEWRVRPEDLAYILYTSGSTGRPKGVEVTHANVVNLMEAMASEPGLTATDALMAVTTLSFDIALLELFLPLVVGGRTLIASRETAADGDRLKYALVRSGATAMQATPATWRMLLEAGFRPGRNLRVLCGGEALPPTLAAELLGSAPEIWNLYGPTETTIWSTVARLQPGDAPALGLPIANTRIYVLDPFMQLVPDGVPGEICIGGAGVARGYHGRPDLTAERFRADPFVDPFVEPVAGDDARLYMTGDIGILRPDGSLHYLGRRDDQLKIRGFRIEPGEVEAALAGYAGVQQVAVVAQRRGAEDARLVAYVRCDDAAFSSEAFRHFLAPRLPAYMIPSLYVRLAELPLTANGKVDRAVLTGRAATVATAAVAPVAPRTPIEAQLAAIWTDVIHVEQPGVQASFFDLGGHSLLAARVMARVEEAFGVRLPMALFFAQATIEAHARYLEQSLPMSDARREQLMAWLEALSEEEAARYLEQRLGTLQGGNS